MLPHSEKMLEMLRERRLGELDAPDLSDDGNDFEPAADSPGGFEFALRKKRRSAILRKMLADGGHQDLLHMVALRERD